MIDKGLPKQKVWDILVFHVLEHSHTAVALLGLDTDTLGDTLWFVSLNVATARATKRIESIFVGIRDFKPKPTF